MLELNYRICKICRELKHRILAGKFDSVNKKWTDENNKLWNGNVCPACVVIKSRENMKKLRNTNDQ